MKKLLSAVVCIVLVLGTSLCGCNKTDGTVEISSANDLKLLSENKDGTFKIVNDIDLGGAEWKPVNDFSGKLSGVWGGIFNHTVSNFTVKADTADEAIGFFTVLNGTVSNLNFKDVTIILPEGFKGSAGALAGTVSSKIDNIEVRNITVTGYTKDAAVGTLTGIANGDITNCYADGSITLTSGGNANIGGMVGILAAKAENIEVRTDLEITAAEGSINAGGIAGKAENMVEVNYGGHIKSTTENDAALYTAQFAGKLSGAVTTGYANARSFETSGEGLTKADFFADGSGAAVDCVIRDISNLDETTLSDTEYALRKKVVDYMYEECTYAWTPSKDMHYEDDCLDKDGNCRHPQDYYAGQTYFGLPYTHNCGSLEKFKSYLNDDRTVVDSVKSEGWGVILGNDCADSVYWALTRISASPTYILTDSMFCDEGMLIIGSYDRNGDSTKQICETNGAQVMYEAYSEVKMGDAVVKGPSGHTRLVAEAPYIYRNEDGSINPDKSYILFHEQGNRASKVKQYHTTCGYIHAIPLLIF